MPQSSDVRSTNGAANSNAVGQMHGMKSHGATHVDETVGNRGADTHTADTTIVCAGTTAQIGLARFAHTAKAQHHPRYTSHW